MMDTKDISATYNQLIYGYDQPDAMWGNGKSILELRRGIGIMDVNDSNGNPIIEGECYCITKGGVTLPVTIPDDDSDDGQPDS